jgi:Mg-chelatase subunit ChlD
VSQKVDVIGQTYPQKEKQETGKDAIFSQSEKEKDSAGTWKTYEDIWGKDDKKDFLSGRSILIILDTSGSMKDPMPGSSQKKIDAAKTEAMKVLETTTGTVEWALMVFNQCTPKVAVDFTQDSKAIKDFFSHVQIQGSTPLSASLKLAGDYVEQHAQYSACDVVLLSDGQETCGGDPVQSAQAFGKYTPSQKQLRLHVIGLDVKGNDLKQLNDVANAGKGTFKSAENIQQLNQAFQASVHDTTSIIVKWPEQPGWIIETGKQENQAVFWKNPWIISLSIVLLCLVIATILITYMRVQPVYYLNISEPEHEPRRIQLSKRSVWIGRDPTCDVIINDPYVSRKHARILIVKRGIRFTDNNTENGSFINEERVNKGFLPFGNRMTIGKTHIQVTK